MVSKDMHEKLRQYVVDTMGEAQIALTGDEKTAVEVADFGLGDIEKTGLLVITYINTARVCSKELILLPRQTCPEHRHPTINGVPGKEETFRCRRGTVYLYVSGKVTEAPVCSPPEGDAAHYTVWHEIKLNPGQQYTLAPDTLHWFQAGPEGCIVSEFSTRSTDDADVFTDPRIRRAPEVES